MSALLLNSLEIKEFRAFRDLRIEKLGRVNLIVGQNNIGKTCLLEALQLYACRAQPSFLWQLLEAHDEDSRSSQAALSSVDGSAREVLAIISNLFYGRPEMTGTILPLEIGPIDEPEKKLRLSLGFYASKINEKGLATLQILSPAEYESVNEPLIPRFSVQLGNSRPILYPLEEESKLLKPEIQPINWTFVEAYGLNKEKVNALWNPIALTDLHQEVVRALRIAAPGLQDFSIIGEFGTKRGHFPIVRAADTAHPLPIRSLGDGMRRLLEIALALANAKDGLLLIDEIESGLHYSTQVELCQWIFQMSHQLNVQVFATSHSWDWVTSFQRAAQENEQEDSMLIRLELKKGEVDVTLADKQDLAIIEREQIEVR